MEESQQSNPEQESQNPNFPPASAEREDPKSKENPEREAKSANTPKCEPHNIIIKVENFPKDEFTIANLIALAAVVVSGFLFYYTYQLFRQAQIQSIAATKAAESAKEAVDEYRQANKTSDSNYQLSKKSLQSQINSITETRKQFQIDNEPYLFIKDPVITKFRVGEMVTFTFEIVNLGKQPVHIYSGKRWAIFDTIRPKEFAKTFRTNKFDTAALSIYVSKENPYTGAFNTPIINQIDSINLNIGLKVFFYGQYKYINLVTGKKKVYYFVIHIFMPPNNGIMETYYSKNTEIKGG